MRFRRIIWIPINFAILALGLVGDEARCAVPRGSFTNVISLGSQINTAAIDCCTSISADGLTLYFNSERLVGEGGQDLYQATRPTTNDPFGNVTNLGPGVNSPDWETWPNISYDGLTLYFASSRPGNVGGFLDLYQATRPTINDEFADVVNLSTINSEFIDRSPEISRDGKTVHFTSNRPDGEGGEDIYVATRESLSDLFTNVTNLGDEINGPNHEFDPSISTDGLVMFFSDSFEEPYRPNGRGGPDIWVAARETIDEPFQSAVNLNDFSLKSDVNTEFSDNAPSISRSWPETGSQLYFNTIRPGGAGEFDIWQATWVPEQLGDFDGYGQLDTADLNRLISVIAAATHDRRLDLTDDNLVNGDDLSVWVTDLKKTWFGDANLDGSFDSADLVQVFQAGEYEDGVEMNSTWGDGDWNADLEFTSGDLVVAFQQGGYEKGRQTGFQVPEPSSMMVLSLGFGTLYISGIRLSLSSSTKTVTESSMKRTGSSAAKA